MQDSATPNSCWKIPYSDFSVIYFTDKKVYSGRTKNPTVWLHASAATQKKILQLNAVS